MTRIRTITRIATVRFAALLVAAALVFAAPPTAQAQDPLKPGDSLTGTLIVSGKQLALPSGPWVVAADGDSGWTSSDVGAYGYLRTTILFRMSGDTVDTVLEVNSNALATMDGWGMAGACSRQDLVWVTVRYKAGWDGSCYFVTHSLLAPGNQPVWEAARRFARQNKWRLPNVAVTAGFRSADRTDILDVRYHFTPETRGIRAEAVSRWRDSAWMASRVEQAADRLAFVKSVRDWAIGYSAIVDSGLKNHPYQGDPITLPQSGVQDTIKDMIAERTAELGLLRQAGAITDDEYAVQKQALDTAASGTASTIPDLSVITAVKGLSYRVIVSFSHLFNNFYWTGNFVTTSALEVLQITINSIKFQIHEIGWAKYYGTPHTDAGRTIDFRYIGVTE